MPVVKYNSFSESCSGRIFSCQDVGQLFAVCMKSWQDGVRQGVRPTTQLVGSVAGPTNLVAGGRRTAAIERSSTFPHKLHEMGLRHVVSRCAGFGDTRALLRGARPQIAFFFFHELHELHE